MLVGFTVENFKSFDNETEFSMVSSTKIKSLEDHEIKIKSVPLLKNAVIYGANASGKSNFINVIDFLLKTMKNDLPRYSADCFCKNIEDNINKKSTFEVKFSLADKFYAFGFSAILNNMEITDEWLYELSVSGKPKPFYLKENSNVARLCHSKATAAEKNRFEIYANDLSASKNRLMITELNDKKRFSNMSILNFIQVLYHEIINNYVVIHPFTIIDNNNKYFNETTLSEITKLMKMFDTGITNVTSKTVPLEEIEKKVPKDLLKTIIEDARNQMSISDTKVAYGTLKSDNDFYGFKFEGNNEPEIKRLIMNHKKAFYDFVYAEESDGTKRLFDLIGIILNKNNHAVYFVDELERSLHPNLTKKFIELFMSYHKDDYVQLITTTHEHSIMNLKLFRRDEIWFIDKDNYNISNLYSLDRFNIRSDKRLLDKAYLEGRYGAIPIFSEICGEVV